MQFNTENPSISISTAPKKGFQADLYTSGCFLIYEGKTLLLKRTMTNKLHPETWSIPGGKKEQNESIREGLIREIFEETGISLEIDGPKEVAKLFIEENGVQFIFDMYFYELLEKPEVILSEREHSDWCWIEAEKAFSLSLIPGGVEAFETFLRWKIMNDT